MTAHHDDHEFDRMISKEFPMEHPPEYIDPTPYGTPVQTHGKPGLTKRGKAAIAIGSVVLAGGSLLTYQHYSAQQHAADAKAQEIALKSQQLKLEELKEMNRAAEADQKTQSKLDKARQASVDACVKASKDLHKGSYAYRQAVEDCQAQYTDGPAGDDMQAAGASHNASNEGGGGHGVNGGLLIGGVALAGFLAVAAKKGKKTNAA